MLFIAIFRLALSLFLSVFSLFPLPSLPDLGTFGSALDTFFSLVPQALGLVAWFVGPTVISLFRFMVQVYLSILDIFGFLVVYSLLRGVVDFVRGLLGR